MCPAWLGWQETAAKGPQQYKSHTESPAKPGRAGIPWPGRGIREEFSPSPSAVSPAQHGQRHLLPLLSPCQHGWHHFTGEKCRSGVEGLTQPLPRISPGDLGALKMQGTEGTLLSPSWYKDCPAEPSASPTHPGGEGTPGLGFPTFPVHPSFPRRENQDILLFRAFPLHGM